MSKPFAELIFEKWKKIKPYLKIYETKLGTGILRPNMNSRKRAADVRGIFKRKKEGKRKMVSSFQPTVFEKKGKGNTCSWSAAFDDFREWVKAGSRTELELKLATRGWKIGKKLLERTVFGLSDAYELERIEEEKEEKEETR